MEREFNLSIRFVPDNKDQDDMLLIESKWRMMQVVGDAADVIPNSIKDLDFKDLKVFFKRYLDILRRTYKVNIEPLNSSLMKQIEFHIELSQSKIKFAKSTGELCLFMLATIGELNLLALGGRLDNASETVKKSKISNKSLKLDNFCSIHYSQTPTQKANLICDYVQRTSPDRLEQIKNQRRKMRNDEGFIEWVKNSDDFVKIYLDLF